jgi:hypothetical protein
VPLFFDSTIILGAMAEISKKRYIFFFKFKTPQFPSEIYSPLEASGINQIRVVPFNVPQLTQASFLQKNQMSQKVFLTSVTLRWHRASVACKNQSF